MDVAIFYKLTPVEFDYALNDDANNRKNSIEIEQRIAYEVARYMLGHQFNISGKSLKRNIEDFTTAFPLPWDGDITKKEPKKQSAETIANALRSIAAQYKQK